jgi:hypothetical protein
VNGMPKNGGRAAEGGCRTHIRPVRRARFYRGAFLLREVLSIEGLEWKGECLGLWTGA